MNLIDASFYDAQFPEKIFMTELELDHAPKFDCDYIKVFEHIMSIYQEGDKRITYDQSKRAWYVKENKE